MSRLIDADELEKAINKWMPKDMETWMDGPIPPIENLVVSIMMTIEEQPTVNEWIPCSERLPEEREWAGTKKFGTTKSDEVYVTFESPKGERFCRHVCFQNGKLSNYDQSCIDAWFKGSKPIAWQALPKPYEAEDDDKKEK